MAELRNHLVQPYTGIGDVQRVGLGVEACAERVARFGYVSKQLMHDHAGKMTSIANWEFKAALGHQMWESALHWGSWRDRLGELRAHEHQIDKHDEGPLYDLFQELLYSHNDAEYAIAIYAVILPAYIAALHRYRAETNPLVDQPTMRAASHVLLDLESHLAFGQSVLGALETADAPALAGWQQHLTEYLEAAGGIDGTQEIRPTWRLPTPRSDGDFRILPSFARDSRFTTSLPKISPWREEEIPDHLLSKMWVRAQEMTAAELCATVLFEWEELPYEGCVDLARHCWDEARHSLFGQAALEAEGIPLTTLPSWVGYARHLLPVPPQKRYAHLAIATEGGVMAYPGGKRGEWEWCKELAQHPLMTTYQDFDWADEVTHVRFGREWLIRFFCKGDRNRANAMADETVAERTAYYAQFAPLGPAQPSETTLSE